MTLRQKLLSTLFALSAFAPLALMPSTAGAQPAAPIATLEIRGFDVVQGTSLAAGTELDFTLYGTAGGLATISIEGAPGNFLLQESEPGVYEGIYSVKRRDKLTAAATVTANLRVGNQVVSAILDESLVQGAKSRTQRTADAAAASQAPRIDRFDADSGSRLGAGNELMYTLTGTPGGRASARIAGVKGSFFLDETQPGLYRGAYTIRNTDRVNENAPVTATLRVGTKETTARLGGPLMTAAGSAPAVAPIAPPAAPRAALCATCGTVEAINVIEVKGEGSYVGLIGGGIAGALLGSQIGKGTGKTVAEIAGAGGGALLGREAEKYLKKTKHFEVVVRLQGGGTSMVSYPTQPQWRVGDKVRVEGGALVAG